MSLKNLKAIPKKKEITVSFLVNSLRKLLKIELVPCSSESAAKKRFVTDTDLHRPGLALAGYVELFSHHRIQVLGNSENQYIRHIGESISKESFRSMMKFDIPVIFLTDNNNLPDTFLEMARESNIPVYRTSLETTEFMFLVRDFLEDQFAVQTMVHGSMVDVYGIGMMITGNSGIGKSEVALDLVERGHRLVSDDVVILSKKNNILIATSSEVSKHFLEIRGLGIVDVISMFGIRSIRYQKRLEVILELNYWDDHSSVERTGLNKYTNSILGVAMPTIKLPITPGKNITVLAEVIAMNHLLSQYGYDSAKTFQNIVKKKISERKKNKHQGIERAVDFFEGDLE